MKKFRWTPNFYFFFINKDFFELRQFFLTWTPLVHRIIFLGLLTLNGNIPFFIENFFVIFFSVFITDYFWKIRIPKTAHSTVFLALEWFLFEKLPLPWAMTLTFYAPSSSLRKLKWIRIKENGWSHLGQQVLKWKYNVVVKTSRISYSWLSTLYFRKWSSKSIVTCGDIQFCYWSQEWPHYGALQDFYNFRKTHQLLFIPLSLTNFQEMLKFGNLGMGNVFQKFTEISLNFLIFFQNQKL